jgi:hypothetical protein
MTVEINWDIDAFLEDCKDVSMEGLEVCADIIRDEARRILETKLRSNWSEHGVYQSGPNKGKYWTEREWQAMVATIRTVPAREGQPNDVWVMAGNSKTWWAVQLEYGKGKWRGGNKSFMRPALRKSLPAMKAVFGGDVKIVMESGNGETV